MSANALSQTSRDPQGAAATIDEDDDEEETEAHTKDGIHEDDIEP
jgi:hypothetical protein